MKKIPVTMYRYFFKRVIDVFISLIGLVVLSPLFLLLIIVLSFAFRGKPFFIQLRPGRNEVGIKVIKFKSMNDARDKDGNLLPNFDRTTKVGGFIRRTSIDELPQLINVLRGDMSLVGPRPLLFKYVPLYSKTQRRRLDIKPGVTGWAQVNGRNEISWKQKFEYDIYYVDHLSFLLDIRILLLTLKKVFLSEGVNAGENVTMPPFNGSN